MKGEVTSDPPITSAALTTTIKAKAEEWGLSDGDVLKAIFNGLVSSVMDSVGSKNTQQVQFSVLKVLKTYHKTLAVFATSTRQEAALLQTIQVGGGDGGGQGRALGFWPYTIHVGAAAGC